jgi:hypothetical protein
MTPSTGAPESKGPEPPWARNSTGVASATQAASNQSSATSTARRVGCEGADCDPLKDVGFVVIACEILAQQKGPFATSRVPRSS